MLRQLVPFVLLVLVTISCSKKTDTPGGNGGGPGPEPRGVESDPNATYTFRIRGVQKDDRTEMARHEASTEIRRGGGNETIKREKRFEYTEHILALPDGAVLPTRLTRNYSIAQSRDVKSGQMQPFAFQGKTVTIEKRGAFYQYTVDGKPLPRTETVELDGEFKIADKVGIDALLPDGPVKVGAHWPISREILVAFGGPFPDVDFSKSMLSGKLTRAYSLDGKQWGQIAFDFDLVIDPDIVGGKVRREEGTLKIAGTFDVVIDGSARDSIMKATVKSVLSGRHKATPTKVEVDATIERTVRTAK
jgi:hypothetical protein